MQYVIRVNGEIANKQNKAYVVNSCSEEEAKKMAVQNFCEDFSVNSDVVYVNSHKRTYKAITAFVFMLIPILLSFINWKNGHDTISISPDYISCFFGVLIYGAFVVRFKGIPRTVSSWIDILFCVFSVLLMATFIKTILVTKNISILGLTEISINTNIVLLVATILSWLGLKAVSLTCIAGTVMLALFNITALNTAMGSICGPLYIICSFIGIMLYIAVEPAFIETVSQLGKVATKSVNCLSRDISMAKTNVVNIKNTISKKVNSSKGE